MEPDLEEYDGPLPLFPLPSFRLLPHTTMPLHVFEPRYVRLVQDTIGDRGLIGMTHFEEGWEEDYYAAPRLRPVGCAGRVTNLVTLPDGRFSLTLVGLRKFEIAGETRSEPYRAARIRWIEDLHEAARGEPAKSAVSGLVELLDALAGIRQEEPEAGILVDASLPLAANVNRLVLASRPDPEDFRALLELRDVYARARRLKRLLSGRIEAHARARRYRKHLPDDPSVN